MPVLAGTRRLPMHSPLLATARPHVAGLDLGVLLALARGPRIVPDFLAPSPYAMTGDVADELDDIAAYWRATSSSFDVTMYVPSPNHRSYFPDAAAFTALVYSGHKASCQSPTSWQS
ncbi:hypothetical protein [Streptomyces sp. NPDC093105]|uniref:hypothetical protein n=1 Tax=Streptomyces sp. NPDC093105 TaxID=3366029 RepID=UPI0038297FA3